MSAKTIDSDLFYGSVPVTRGFRSLMDPTHYLPLPDDWSIGAADVVGSTKAIADNRYKAVNMAGAAIVASVTNVLGGLEFPFVFGADGASLAVSASDREAAYGALAATASWTTRELGLTLRVAMLPMQEVRSHGFDVLVARYAVSEHLSYAMFSGGGIAWADAAMKRGEYAISPAPPDTWPNLTGLSCRFREIRSARGVILSVLVAPAIEADPVAFRKLAEEIVGLTEQSPDAGRPVPAGGPGFTWPSPGAELEARTAKGDRRLRRIRVLFETFHSSMVPTALLNSVIPTSVLSGEKAAAS